MFLKHFNFNTIIINKARSLSRWPATFVALLNLLPIKALLAFTGVHADLALGSNGLRRSVHCVLAALLLTFLASVAVVAVPALGADHVPVAAAAGVTFLEFRTALLTLVQRGPAGYLAIRLAEPP